jgi:hypothetical protein
MAATQENAGGFPAHWSGRIAKWEFSLFLDNVTRQTENFTQLDERGSWFYEAVGVTEGMLGN